MERQSSIPDERESDIYEDSYRRRSSVDIEQTIHDIKVGTASFFTCACCRKAPDESRGVPRPPPEPRSRDNRRSIFSSMGDLITLRKDKIDRDRGTSWTTQI